VLKVSLEGLTAIPLYFNSCRNIKIRGGAKMLNKNLVMLIAVGFLALMPVTGYAAEEAEVSAPTEKSKMYYFYSKIRCPSCRAIEAYTKEAFDENFQDKLEFKAISISEPENRHYVNDYKLYTKSVILVKMENGEEVAHKNLQKIWMLLRDKEEFKSYIKNETESFLLN
jgi:hypothetical protein